MFTCNGLRNLSFLLCRYPRSNEPFNLFHAFLFRNTRCPDELWRLDNWDEGGDGKERKLVGTNYYIGVLV